MKTDNIVTTSFIDRILPKFGNPRENIPIYDNTQNMFLSNTYTSESGNMYYKGIRFSDRLVMVEHVGLYKSWTYIDELEVYVFNGTERILMGKKKFDKHFYDPNFIKEEALTLVVDYLKSQMILSGEIASDETIKNMAYEFLLETYNNPLEKMKSLPEATKQMLN